MSCKVNALFYSSHEIVFYALLTSLTTVPLIFQCKRREGEHDGGSGGGDHSYPHRGGLGRRGEPHFARQGPGGCFGGQSARVGKAKVCAFGLEVDGISRTRFSGDMHARLMWKVEGSSLS